MRKNIIIAIFIIALLFGVYSYFKIQNNFTNNKESEINVIIKKVSGLYLFPEGEVPTIATVSDPSLLKKETFFSKAEKDDIVLIFSIKKKAVLYRPSLNKIIDMISIQSNVNK